jgi:hypothetical protein
VGQNLLTDKKIVSAVLTSVNPLERVAVGRLLEFLSDPVPWNRSLWGIGVVLGMDELFEACEAMRQGHLSEASIKRIASSLQRRVGVHPAFSEAEKAFLREQVKQVPRADGAAHFGIRELSCRVSRDYLLRWRQAVVDGRYSVEHFARSVSAHLLDAGFAAQYLNDLIRARLGGDRPISLADLCEDLSAQMVASPLRTFEVLLAFTSVPEFPNGVPLDWLQGPQVPVWLHANGFDAAAVRAPVAKILKVKARDSVGAAKAAREESDRYAARALIATGRVLSRLPSLWVKGGTGPVAMSGASRGVGVKELFREDRVFSADSNQSVDAALELLAHMEGSSAPAAIAGGWAAIEGLLADPSDRSLAADNLATLVTCSFPRAELTALSHKAQRRYPDSTLPLRGLTVNRERWRVMAQLILDDRLPPFPAVADQAAVARVKKLLANPGPELQAIRDSIGDAFHRLYRQRNLILHGARLDSVVLTASLRTVSKLAGAGMDRITHGHYVQKLRPLELVAKANLAIALTTRSDPLGCVDLLEVG